MENLIEGSVCTNTRCYTCGALVYAVEKKVTTYHIYHNRCFRCRICKRNLNGSILNEEGDDIYCTNCYRKKQRGDCNGLDFQRAAAERAQYIHNNGHPDQPPPIANPRRPIQHELSRHPSWTLRQLERQFLSQQQQPKTNISEKINENYRKLVSIPHSLSIKTSFSTPVNLTKDQRNTSLTKDDPSPLFEFLPVLSPLPNNNTESKATPPKTPQQSNETKINGEQVKSTPKTPQQSNETKINNEQVKSTTNSFDDIRSRLNQSNIDLTNDTSPSIERRHSIVVDLNQKNENKDKQESKFRFPDLINTPARRRNSSISYLLHRRKIK